MRDLLCAWVLCLILLGSGIDSMAGRISWNGSFAGQHTSDFSEFSNNVRDFRQLIIRPYQSMAIDGEGKVFYFNQDGQHDNEDWEVLSDLPGKAVQLVAMLDTVYILTGDGIIYATNGWGPNFHEFRSEPKAEKLAATQYELAILNEDGTVSVLNKGRSPGVPLVMRIPDEINGNIKDIAAGDEHFIALTEDGQVLAWGEAYDNRTRVPAAAGGAIKIAAGAEHSLALMPNGMVIAWGSNFWNQCDVPLDLLDVIDIYAGGVHSAAVTRHGQVVLWGSDMENETGPLSVDGGTVVHMALCAGGTAMIHDFPTPGAPAPSPPHSQIISPGQNVAFEVTIPGDIYDSVQWFRNGELLPDQTTPVYQTGQLPASGVDTISVTVSVNGNIWDFDNIYCFSDRDSDRVPDWIEIREGMNIQSGDSDNDGIDDREEILNSLNPTAPMETGPENIEKSTSLVLSFPTVENVTYTIRGTDNLRDWVDVSGNMPGTGQTSLFYLSDRSRLDHRFYTISRDPEESLPHSLSISPAVTSASFFTIQAKNYQFMTEEKESGEPIAYGPIFSGSGRWEMIRIPESLILDSLSLQVIPIPETEGETETE